jgi:GNAT superfamily N-acetyltransferase
MKEADQNHTPSTEGILVGFARCVTDFTTFSYLTDVWIDPSYQGIGLGTWLLMCVRTCTDSMPHLRRSLLFTGSWDRSVPFYKEVLGMTVSAGEPGVSLALMERKGPGHPSFGSVGHGYR